jgi:hypothetical protein
MKKAILGGLSVVFILLSLTRISPSCTHDNFDPTLYDTVCFQSEILPVFKNGCAVSGCHSSNGEEMDLSDYQGIRAGVMPGNPAQSHIYQHITASLNEPMPPGNPLAEADRIRIRIWIEQGATETKCVAEPSIIETSRGDQK